MWNQIILSWHFHHVSFFRFDKSSITILILTWGDPGKVLIQPSWQKNFIKGIESIIHYQTYVIAVS